MNFEEYWKQEEEHNNAGDFWVDITEKIYEF